MRCVVAILAGAKTLVLSALAATPAQIRLIGDYLEQASDDEANEKLPVLLDAAAATENSATTPKGPDWRDQLKTLWVRAAEIHVRKGDGQKRHRPTSGRFRRWLIFPATKQAHFDGRCSKYCQIRNMTGRGPICMHCSRAHRVMCRC